MRCWTVVRRLPAYLESSLAETEHRQVQFHLAGCGECADRFDRQRQARSALRALPRVKPPAELAIRLRVIASRERLIDRTPSSFVRRWWETTKLSLNNMMKPIALPAAGGLCSALLLFSSLMPAITWHWPGGEDVPLSELTGPQIKTLLPIGFTYGDAEVDLSIDPTGHIVNYAIIGGSGPAQDALRRSIENNLLFTTFTPATEDGVAVPSTMRLSFRSSRIDVRG